MPVAIRKSAERGHFKNEWLDSYHSFSFADYYDPKHMNFRTLRVINHDLIQADTGFEKHPHRDMEIITYVLQGTVEHQDSLGNKEHIHAGEVQVISAGTGILHSEFNPSADSALELLQIWVTPNKAGLKPSYQQKMITVEAKKNQWALIVSNDGRDSSLKIHQDVLILASILESKKNLSYEIKNGRAIWIQVAKGKISVNNQNLSIGDAVAIESEAHCQVQGISDAEIILFDLGPN